MLILLYGPDDYRREAKRRQIVAEFKKKHGLANVAIWDGADPEVGAALKVFQGNQSMFEPAKLGVIKNPAGLDAKTIKEIRPVLAEKNFTLLLSEGDKLTKNWEYFTKSPVAAGLPAQAGLVRETFQYLDGLAWLAFIKKEAKARAVDLSESMLQLLSQRYAHDTWRLITELDKLSSLAGRALKVEDLGRADPELSPDFWPMVGALTSPDFKIRLTMLERVIALNEPAAKLFNLIAYQNPQKIRLTAEYDKLIKSGKLDYEEALLALLIA